MINRAFLLASALVVALSAGGCAHPISLATDAGTIAGTGTAKIDRKVGLAITDEQKKREVTTPGGGGDKVSYFPYRDLESGLYFALSQSFSGVSRVSGASDPKVAADGLTLIIVPEITTQSHSPSMLTWPPTVFTIDLSCTVKDPQDRVVTQFRVQGEGRAEFDEFKSDTSLAAKRAAQDALKKLVKALGDNSAKLR
jgi:hypothetical protein